MANFTAAPWEVADGIVICQGGSQTGPGKILFVLRAPTGTRESYPHELLAEYSDLIVKAVNSHAEIIKALELQEAADLAHLNCDECDGEDDPHTCRKCFPLYDDARVARRLALQVCAITPAERAES